MTQRFALRLRRSLADPIPAPAWPTDTRLIPFDPEQHPRAFHALLEAGYAQGGGSVPGFDEWWPALREDSEYDPELCLVAVNGAGEIVGAMQCWTSAFIKDLVVKPSQRRSGLGSALLNEAFRRFKARGAEHVDLKVQSDNPTGAVRLYLAHGMKQVDAQPLD